MNIPSNVIIKKKTGPSENYSKEKFYRSLTLAGLDNLDIENISKEIEKKLDIKNLSTTDLYNESYPLIYKKSRLAGMKYSLKNALFLLGPSGFIFEKFIARCLASENFVAENDLILEGHCVRHEVDLKASKGDLIILAEIKFHNRPETKNDLKTALYVKARMDDLKLNPANKFNYFFLISNTSFSKDAIKYSTCAGLNLIGYNFPLDRNLYDIITDHKLYPITCLPWLKKKDIDYLLNSSVIILPDLFENKDLLKKLSYSDETINNFIKFYNKHYMDNK